MNCTDYFSNPALGSTDIKAILANPYAWKIGIRQGKTRAMDLGSAIHCALLEPGFFSSRFIINDRFNDFRTKEAREWRDHAEASGLTILSTQDMETIHNCIDSIESVRNDDFDLKKMLAVGTKETPVFTEMHGVQAKCKPDVLIADCGICMDIKTTDDASVDGFWRAVKKYGYHISAAWYIDVLKHSGIFIDKFWFVFIEKSAPYMVGIYALEYDSDVIIRGRELYMQAIEKYKNIDKYNSPIYIDNGQIINENMLPPMWVLN